LKAAAVKEIFTPEKLKEMSPDVLGEENRVPFLTVKVEDPSLTAELEAAKIPFSERSPAIGCRRFYPGRSRGVIFSVVELSCRNRVGKRRLMQIGKSKAKVYIEKKTGVTFADVAGIDERRRGREVVGFLKIRTNIKDWAAVFQRRLNRRPPAREKLCLPAPSPAAGVPFSALRL